MQGLYKSMQGLSGGHCRFFESGCWKRAPDVSGAINPELYTLKQAAAAQSTELNSSINNLSDGAIEGL